MADKEEKIWIEYGIPKPKGAIKSTRRITITRLEAIRKMCDAYFKAKDEGAMESERMEAALDALLSLQSKRTR